MENIKSLFDYYQKQTTQIINVGDIVFTDKFGSCYVLQVNTSISPSLVVAYYSQFYNMIVVSTISTSYITQTRKDVPIQLLEFINDKPTDKITKGSLVRARQGYVFSLLLLNEKLMNVGIILDVDDQKSLVRIAVNHKDESKITEIVVSKHVIVELTEENAKLMTEEQKSSYCIIS